MIKLKYILLEGKFDAYVLDMSRRVIDAFKSKKNLKRQYELTRGEETAEFNLIVKLLIRPNQDYSHSITGGGDMDNLTLDIEYNPNHFPSAMNNLVAEVKEVITHELEHVGQQNFEDMFIVDNKKFNDYYNYLTSNKEVPAYVKGLIKRALTKRISLNSAMEEWYRENILNFEYHKVQWQRVRFIWKNWAIENKNKIKKYK